MINWRSRGRANPLFLDRSRCFHKRRDEKSHPEKAIRKKEVCGKERDGSYSCSERAPRSRVCGDGEERNVLCRGAAALTSTFPGSGEAGRVVAKRSIQRDMALLSDNAAFNPCLLSRRVSRCDGERARGDYCRHYLCRKSARPDS